MENILCVSAISENRYQDNKVQNSKVMTSNEQITDPFSKVDNIKTKEECNPDDEENSESGNILIDGGYTSHGSQVEVKVENSGETTLTHQQVNNSWEFVSVKEEYEVDLENHEDDLMLKTLNSENLNTVHRKQTTHKCEFCDYSTAQPGNLKVHVNARHTKRKMHKCGYCVFESAYPRAVKLHVNALHTKQNLHKCDYCAYEAGHFRSLKEHVKKQHTKQDMHKCEYCEYKTVRAYRIKAHVKARHAEENLNKCDYEIPQLGIIISHVKAEHSK